MAQQNFEGNACDLCRAKVDKLEKVGMYWCCPSCAEKERIKNKTLTSNRR
jgi:lipopolysaccharide biosynthesis regulator YciM